MRIPSIASGESFLLGDQPSGYFSLRTALWIAQEGGFLTLEGEGVGFLVDLDALTCFKDFGDRAFSIGCALGTAEVVEGVVGDEGGLADVGGVGRIHFLFLT